MTGAKTASPEAARLFPVAAICALLAALCALVYIPALSNGFVWDDELFLTRNPAVSSGFSAQSLRWAFTTFHTGNWHPLTWVSHLADVSLFGLEPLGHHLVSLLLHAANAALTFLVFRRMTGAFWNSALLAALFAAHPLHVESVAWVAERKDVLSTFCMLLALLAWLCWVRRPRPRWYAASVALYALALLAKPMPVTFPFLLLLLDWWPLGRFAPRRRMALVAEKLPLAALTVASAAVTLVAQSSVGAVGSIPLLVRLANAVLSYWRYVGKALWPARLALLYPFPAEEPPRATAVLAVAGLAAVTILVLWARRNLPALTVGWFWFLGTLVPVIGLVQVGTQSMADRYTYVPLNGLFVMVLWGGGTSLGGNRSWRPWLAAAAVAAVALCAAVARAQVGMWRDQPAAFTNVLRVSGENLIAHNQLALYYHEHGNERQAEVHARAALALAPEDAGAHVSLAHVLGGTNRIEEAIAEYRTAIRADPLSAEAHANLAVLLAARGESREAESSLRQALEVRPDYPEARSNLGKLLAKQGRIAEALPQFREAVRLSPRSAIYLSDLGAALAALGRLDEGLPFLEQAVRLDPGLAIARENLAKARGTRNRIR